MKYSLVEYKDNYKTIFKFYQRNYSPYLLQFKPEFFEEAIQSKQAFFVAVLKKKTSTILGYSIVVLMCARTPALRYVIDSVKEQLPNQITHLEQCAFLSGSMLSTRALGLGIHRRLIYRRYQFCYDRNIFYIFSTVNPVNLKSFVNLMRCGFIFLKTMVVHKKHFRFLFYRLLIKKLSK